MARPGKIRVQPNQHYNLHRVPHKDPDMVRYEDDAGTRLEGFWPEDEETEPPKAISVSVYHRT